MVPFVLLPHATKSMFACQQFTVFGTNTLCLFLTTPQLKLCGAFDKQRFAFMQRQREAMEAQAAQEERHEQGKRRAKLEAGFAEVSPAMSCPVLLLDLNRVRLQVAQC